MSIFTYFQIAQSLKLSPSHVVYLFEGRSNSNVETSHYVKIFFCLLLADHLADWNWVWCPLFYRNEKSDVDNSGALQN